MVKSIVLGVGVFSRAQVFMMLLTWLFSHKLGEEFFSEKPNRGRDPVLKVAQKATTTATSTITQGRPGTRREAVAAPEANTYSAVVLCFSPTEDVVFLIAVIPGITAGQQLALSCRGHRQQVSLHPGRHTCRGGHASYVG